MKKVAIFYPHIGEYGGIERNIIALAERVHRNGFVPVLVCYYDRINMKSLFPKLEVVVLKDHWNPLVKSNRLKKWLHKSRKDINGMPLFFGGKAAFYAGISWVNHFVLHYTDPPSLLGVNKNISNLKGLLAVPRRYLSDRLITEGVRRAELLLTMTNRNAEELQSLYNKTFKVVLQGGLEPSTIVNDSPRCTGGVLRIFSICRIASSKNLEWILETANYLRGSPAFKNDFKKMEVVIAGTGPHLQHLQKKSAELAVDDCVQFPGFLDSAEVEEEYRKSDLFLVPARQGYGLPVLEALYRHVPVVLNVESRISEILNANPWAAVSQDSVDSFRQTVLFHISQLRRNYPDALVLDSLPSERRWADEVGENCKWW